MKEKSEEISNQPPPPTGLSSLIEATLLPLSELGKIKNVKIELTEYEKVDKGLFSSTYINYIIKTSPLNWEVRRRYSDFCTLREILVRDYPSHYVYIYSKINLDTPSSQ